MAGRQVGTYARAQDPQQASYLHPNDATTSSRVPVASTADRSGASPLQQLPPQLLARVALAAGRHHIAPLCKHLSALLTTALPPTILQPVGRTTPATFNTAFPSTIARHASTLTTLDLSHLGYLLTPAHLPLLSPASLPHLSSLTLRRFRLDPPSLLDTLPLNPALTHLALLSQEAPVSDTCLFHISTSAPHLRSLSLLVGHLQNTGALEFQRSISALSALSRLTRLRMNSYYHCPFTSDTAALLLSTTASLAALQSLVIVPIEVVLSDTMCATLARHTRLTELALSVTHPDLEPPTGPLLMALAQLTQLRRLSLTSPIEWHLTSDLDATAWPLVTSGLAAIESLRLSCYDLDSLWPAAFPGGALSELYLDAHYDPGSIYSEHPFLPLLCLAPTLKALHLSRMPVSTDTLEVVAQLTGLTQLSLRCDLEEDARAAGYQFPSLHRLAGLLKSLTLCIGIGSYVLRSVESATAVLGPLTGLTHLQLADVDMTDAVLAGGGWLTGMQQLQCLNLLDQERLVGPGLHVLRWLPQLTHVAISTRPRWTDVSGHWVHHLIPPPPQLQRVSHQGAALSDLRKEMIKLLSPYGIEVSYPDVCCVGCWNDLHHLD